MPAPRGNQLARRVVDDLIEFSSQTSDIFGWTCRNQIAQLNALIAEMEAFDDPGEVFDTLIGLRDDVRVENAKLIGLNKLVSSDMCSNILRFAAIIGVYLVSIVMLLAVDYRIWCMHFEELDASIFILDKLSKVAESPCLADKMNKKRRLVAELEAVGEVEGVVKCLEHMRVIVARDAVTLEELETLLGNAQVGVSLKVGFVADMEVKD
ncbi:hypothetical protein Tco_0683677 [Tanacetum coccineum]